MSADDILIDSIWNYVESKSRSKQELECSSESPTLNTTNCPNCINSKIQEINFENTCTECGLVISSNYISLSYVPFEDDSLHQPRKRNFSNKENNKLAKMQEWYRWTNEEKSEYKLNSYTENICRMLQLPESLFDVICKTVSYVMASIKKYDGTKRARVKDGIILVCIQYVFRNQHLDVRCPQSAVDLAKKLSLDIKYVTKAEKIILELVSGNKLSLDINDLLHIKSPMDHVHYVNEKHHLQLPDVIIQKVERLVNYCGDNNLLLDHTPLAIGVCCLYYVLRVNDIDIDLKLYSSMYDISIVTILKTFNKLKMQTQQQIKT